MPKFNPPEAINWHKPNWPEWRDRFQRYRTATKLNKEEGDIQVSTLIYSMGNEAEKVFKSFSLTAEEQENFDIVLRKFEAHFIPKRNVIFERSVFHQRTQHENESVTEFIQALYHLSEHCEFADREIQIRDRLVIGLADKTVCEKLQLKEDLTLAKAQEIAKAHELVKNQNSDLSNIDTVSFKSKEHKTGFGKKQPHFQKFHRDEGATASVPSYQAQRQKTGKCGKCGRQHAYKQCPAFGKKCHKCGKLSHFAAQCRNTSKEKGVHEIQRQDSKPRESYFIGAIENNVPPWMTSIEVEGQLVTFKIDTGADVNILNTETWDKMGRPPLTKPKSRLFSPAGKIPTRGKFKANINDSQAEMFVVETSTPNLLSRTTASNMGLIQLVSPVTADFGRVDCEPVKIKLKPDSKPYAIPVARRVPIPLMKKVEKELERMKQGDIIEEISEPTDWVSPMVPVIKPNGDVRICVDLKRLNSCVERERYIIPTMEDIIHKLKGAKVFSKLDAASGYWQIPLHDETAKLTTFITHTGRFFFKRLPFGISSAPEIFQKLMEQILKDVQNVVCYFDDILIYSEDIESHKKSLLQVKQKLCEAGLQLNEEKCTYFQKEIKFLGHILSEHGVRPDPEKVQDIKDMPEPSDVPELRRFLGMVQYLGRYLKNLSTVLGPLNQLLKKENEWTWGSEQQKAFHSVKELLTNSQTLVYFDLDKETVVSADSSSYGLGAVLLQGHEDTLKPVAYASRMLTNPERGYAQIEKECLASTWACERFQKYLVGLESFRLITDHKPLVPLINTKNIQECPLRCQRLLMRLMRFNIKAEHIPGKEMVVADTLSRNLTTDKTPTSTELQENVEIYVQEVVSSWPISDTKLNQVRTESEKDVCLRVTMDYTRRGWPEYKEDVKLAALGMFPFRNELSIVDGLLVRNDRLVIPYVMQKDVLGRIHEGHFGIAKCRERANQSVWWPGISQDIKDLVAKCRHCIEKKPSQRREPMMPSTLPDRAFQKVGVDLFEYERQSYLVMEDYYSRYIEIMHLPSTTSRTVICKLKSCFSRYGIPNCVVSDNARQFSSGEFKEFAQSWNFVHVTSSPRYPQSNGKAERAVKTAKEILAQEDIFLAVLAYRSSPIMELGISPAELAFGRKLRNTVPCLPKKLKPQHISWKQFKNRNEEAKKKQKKQYDRHHGVRELPELHKGETVLIKIDQEKEWKNPAQVLKKVAPRSYLVRTENHGDLRRNRRHLRQVPPHTYPEHRQLGDLDEEEDTSAETVNTSQSLIASPSPPVEKEETIQPAETSTPGQQEQITLRRSNRLIKVPKRLDL